jgi:signal peptidase II
VQSFKYPQLWWLKFVVGSLCLFLDYQSKEWARTSLPAFGGVPCTIPVLDQIIRFALVTNTGAAFSLGRGHGLIMAILASLITLVLIGWVLKEEQTTSGKTPLIGIGAGFLIGGALGNLLDRVMRQRVTDFIEFSLFQFPVFNVADVCIDIGIGLIIISALLAKNAGEKDKEKENETIEESQGS